MSAKAANLAYKPMGIVGKVVAGKIAATVITKVWNVAGTAEDHPPRPRTRTSTWGPVLLAAALQGLIGSVAKAGVDRAGARQFEKWTGSYPEA